MEKLFLSVLNMSLTASFVIAAIMLARLLLKKAPKIISYALWAVAGFRLVFPFTLEGIFSLLPFKSAPIPADIAMQAVPRIDSGITVVDNAVSSMLPAAAPVASVNPLQIWLAAGAYIWLIGMAVMLVYSIVSIFLLKKQLHGATLVEGNLFEAGNLKTPFVIGLISPRIYIPAGLTGEERRYIILHEQTHIRRHDHAVKMFAYFVLCLHWFNPFAWVAFLFLGADMEMSCDERVLKEMGDGTKKAYSMSLLSMATERRILGGSPLAFGEGGMKERIKNVLDFKKPSRIIIIAAVVLAVGLTVGLAVNRADKSARNSAEMPEVTATQVTLYRYSGDAANPLGAPLLQNGPESEVQIPDAVAIQIHYPKGTMKLSLYCQPVAGNPILLRSGDFTVENVREGMTPDIRNPDIFVWKVTDKFPNGFDGTIWAEAESASDNMFPDGVKPNSEIIKAVYTTDVQPWAGIPQKTDWPTRDMTFAEITFGSGRDWIVYRMGREPDSEKDNTGGSSVMTYHQPPVKKNGADLPGTAVDVTFYLDSTTGYIASSSTAAANGVYRIDVYGDCEMTGRESSDGTLAGVLSQYGGPNDVASDGDVYTLWYYSPEDSHKHMWFEVKDGELTKRMGIVSLDGQSASEPNVPTIIENVNSQLDRDVEFTNGWRSPLVDADENGGKYIIVQVGSLKSDPEQGVAVVCHQSKDSEQYVIDDKFLTPNKHGAIIIESLGAKDFNMSVVAADGYKWIFDIYNGFQAGAGTEPDNQSVSTAAISNLDWAWPVEGYDTLSSSFGMRIHPVTKTYTFCDHIEIAAPKGASVSAALAGTVSEADYDDEQGNYIVITHDNGLETIYRHLSEQKVSKGDVVAAGDTIGAVGATGKATGAFLAFCVYKDGNAVNPMDYLK